MKADNRRRRAGLPREAAGRSVNHAPELIHQIDQWEQIEDVVNEERRLERAKGIEPSCAVWKTAVLPLNYARLKPVRDHPTHGMTHQPVFRTPIIAGVLALSIHRR